MNNEFLRSVKKQFNDYKALGEKTFSQLSDEQLFWRYNEESNSVATLVKHMWGNMLSRWTDFLTSDGEKDWRKRDEEFENDLKGRKEMLDKWNEGWACLFKALDSLTEDDLGKEVFVRQKPLTVTDAIHRQLTHYVYHVGQIVYIGKMLRDDQWVTLSVPKKGKN